MLQLTTTTIHVKRSGFTERDRHGNLRQVWGDPEPVEVYAVAPATREETTPDGRRYSVTSGWEIYAPAGTLISPHDLIILDGGIETQVIGEIEDWTHTPHLNPFGTGGVRIRVERSTG